MSFFDLPLDAEDIAALEMLRSGGAVPDRKDAPEVFRRLLRLGLAERKLISAYGYAPCIVISGAGRDCLKYHCSCQEEMRRQQAEQEAEKRAQDAQRVKDKKQARIHDFAVAAFSSALTLSLEHIEDIAHFIESFF